MTATTDEQRLAAPPRDGVRRTSPFGLRADEGDTEGDGLTLDGYAAVFNRETVIDSWEGRFREKIAPGAMKRSFQEAPPRVQFDHGQHPLIGSIPIGSVESIREDSHPTLAPEGGAHIVARLHDNWLIEPVRDAIKSGSVDGMSFRFSVLQDEWRTAEGKLIKDARELEDLLRQSWMDNVPDEELLVRTLRQLKVPEVGPVVWPAYSDTSVGVRSQTITIDLGRLHEPDQRSLLAQAVLMTDRADAETQDPTPSVRDEAEVHVKPVNDAQHVTPTADEHESASKRHEVQAELARVRANNIRANSQKERYSS
jgi:HK97 family phage prohead protease